MSPVQRLLRWFPATWAAIDRQAAEERAAWQAAHPGEYDSSVAQVLVLAAVILTAQWYWGDRPFFQEMWGQRVGRHPVYGRYLELLAFTWWSASKLAGFLLVPAAHIRLLGGRLRDHGFTLRPRPLPGQATPPGKWIYLVLFAVVLPALVIASTSKAFQDTYPFYREARRSWVDFLGWELQYGATFICLEFFFRGYLLFALRRALGSYAIFVMTVPYCMVHVLKPAAESLGAIAAGIVLGTLALGTGSIYYGVLIHVSVAWSMDLLSTWHQHAFPHRLWP